MTHTEVEVLEAFAVAAVFAVAAGVAAGVVPPADVAGEVRRSVGLTRSAPEQTAISHILAETARPQSQTTPRMILCWRR